ncbi:hypothetical protein CHS0354_014035 [Potamilus streckersoni]|uniref:Uncharacterized protein n=1 Tax=Potamilus streckersoni TaxID=2493646 RepID=A0AAE0RUM1_9BIVA|nr:hypothetical protein CHS0354_014035 [Potamilus streckersoni]
MGMKGSQKTMGRANSDPKKEGEIRESEDTEKDKYTGLDIDSHQNRENRTDDDKEDENENENEHGKTADKNLTNDTDKEMDTENEHEQRQETEMETCSIRMTVDDMGEKRTKRMMAALEKEKRIERASI